NIKSVGCEGTKHTQHVFRPWLSADESLGDRIDIDRRNHSETEYCLVFPRVASQNVQVSAILLPGFGYRRAGRQRLPTPVKKRANVRKPHGMPEGATMGADCTEWRRR